MEIDFVGIVLRWMHIFAAIALFGGAIFQRLALSPAMSQLPADQQEAVRDAIRRRWSKVVMVSILLLLVSGIVNLILTVRLFKDPNPKLPTYYHILFGIKFILAMAIFFLASVLSGRSEGTKSFRENASKWLGVTLILATIVVGISGVLRSTHTGPNIKPPATSSSQP